MPLPEPRGQEERDEFLDRCMGDETMADEYPDRGRRYAVCVSLWERRKMAEKTEWKSVRLKDAEFDDERGSIRAVFATMNVIDADRDMTIPGAFGQQRVRISAYGHGSWMGELPVGKGRIFERGEDAVLEGRFFLSTQTGREHYYTVKEMGDLQEWSYALPEVDWEMQTIDGEQIRVLKRIVVPEVSPVLLGAGVNTRTEQVKAAVKSVIGTHETGTNDGEWDAGANERRVRTGESRAYYRRIYGWYDANGSVGEKQTYKFIHHFVDGEGDPGDASTRACSNGIGILNGGRGGADIPDSDRRGVWRHLAAHLRDAGQEPPELRSRSTRPFADQIEDVRARVRDVIERAKAVQSLRAVEGRSISEATQREIEVLRQDFEELFRELKQDDNDDPSEGILGELVRFQKTTARRWQHAE